MSLEVVIGLITAGASTLLALYIRYLEAKTRADIERIKAEAEAEKSNSESRLAQEKEWREAEEAFRKTLNAQIDSLTDLVNKKESEVEAVYKKLEEQHQTIERLERNVKTLTNQLSEVKKRLKQYEDVA
jgi:septal ring factor EnvC (AmiA/AmiB activator)